MSEVSRLRLEVARERFAVSGDDHVVLNAVGSIETAVRGSDVVVNYAHGELLNVWSGEFDVLPLLTVEERAELWSDISSQEHGE